MRYITLFLLLTVGVLAQDTRPVMGRKSPDARTYIQDTVNLAIPQWGDMLGPATLGKTNASAPGFDTTTCGASYSGTQDQILYYAFQIPHGYVEGTAMEPHVHWLQTAADTVHWQLYWRVCQNGDDCGGWQTALPMQNAFPYVSGTVHQITKLGRMDMTGTRVSAVIQCKLMRLVALDEAGAQVMTSFDIHYQINSFGSATEYAK